eukprot:CAMPEP_0169137898 /NCGR_PEP_ID=MMETSP1015-20121227/41840_1 /TAXON_ID=342587 /ORGANISM="Karlodinium micrum, Strain CCMP2283" /LENGTH=433 /DNA_ID=CAMNT_0009202885 /DNA_START=22 /DNA_END=1320 /DNA_ORIENTATION=+
MAVPQQRPSRTQAVKLLRHPRGTPPRSVPCQWCGQRIPPACCSKCLNELAHTPKEVAEAAQRSLATSLVQLKSRLALLERHTLLVERLADLRAVAERRAAAAKGRRRQLERRREELRERRQRNETRAVEWAAAGRRLEAKRCRISCDEFLRDTARYSQSLGAFHIYTELAVARSALQAERKRRCAELVSIFPLKWIVQDAVGDRTVSLAQVPSFSVLSAAGVLKDDDRKDMEAALSYLLPLVAGLAEYLDVMLPFPCTGAQGYEESVRIAEVEANRVRAQSEGSVALAPQTAWWVRPCVLHPFTERWHNFSIYDGICTSEFLAALRFLDEDLRRICLCQGEVPPADFSTLQLLASSLSAAELGCVSPPFLAPPSMSASVSQAGTSSIAVSSVLNGDSWRLTTSNSSTQHHDGGLQKGRRRPSADPASFEDGEW